METLALLVLLLIAFIGIVLWCHRYYVKINNSLLAIKEYKPTIEKQLDLRFSSYEVLIKKVERLLAINETFLKDVVQLRTEAHGARVQKNQAKEFAAESKITLVSKNLGKILSDYKELRGDKEIGRAIKNVIEQEDDLQSMMLKYNILLDEYHSLIFGLPGSLLIKVFPKLYKSLPYSR